MRPISLFLLLFACGDSDASDFPNECEAVRGNYKLTADVVSGDCAFMMIVPEHLEEAITFPLLLDNNCDGALIASDDNCTLVGADICEYDDITTYTQGLYNKDGTGAYVGTMQLEVYDLWDEIVCESELDVRIVKQ